MQLTFYGHSSFHIRFGDKDLVFDPFISPNAEAAAIDVDAIPADYLLLSHGHEDHVADAARIGQRTGATVVSNFEVAAWFGDKGLKWHPVNHGGKVQLDGVTAKYVNAVHSSTLPDGSSGGDPGGFVVWDAERCFYFAGDTALTMDMKLIPMTCPKLDFAILPIGDNFTMGYEDALIASDFIECDKIVGCHFDTFGYIKIDHAAAQKAFADKGKELVLLSIGETIEL